MKTRDSSILVVEDDPATRFLLKEFLKPLGEISTCNDGAEAWDYLVNGNDIDLVVTDHEMPNLSGRDLVLKIRQSAFSFRRIPIIMVTASITREEMTGVDLQGFYGKPISQAALLTAARSAMANRE